MPQITIRWISAGESADCLITSDITGTAYTCLRNVDGEVLIDTEVNELSSAVTKAV